MKQEETDRDGYCSLQLQVVNSNEQPQAMKLTSLVVLAFFYDTW